MHSFCIPVIICHAAIAKELWSIHRYIVLQLIVAVCQLSPESLSSFLSDLKITFLSYIFSILLTETMENDCLRKTSHRK